VRVFEGHAFVVEAAVSIGGRELKPGINVYRFANRIPLLFEGGSDVITRTALKRINWATYKINQAADRVRVGLPAGGPANARGPGPDAGVRGCDVVHARARVAQPVHVQCTPSSSHMHTCTAPPPAEQG
jgi:hypothetical protein